ncbi:MAG: helix-turn-helix domain-containing protein [Cyanobacteria bacterium P01_E01_bin.6]
MPTLTDKHHKAIALLADGMSQGDIAKSLNVTRETISRWCNKNNDFAAELDAEIKRRASREKEARQTAADQVQDVVIKDYREEMLRYHRTLISAYRQRLDRGLKLMNKAGKRFDDLPEESIKPSDVSSLIAIGDRLIQSGLEDWGQAIKIDQALERMNGEISR